MIRRHRLAIARTAKNDAAFELFPCDRFSNRPNEQRIIHLFFRVRSIIADVVAEFLKQFLDLFLVSKPRVVGAYGDVHGTI